MILEDGFPVTYANVESITSVSGRVEVATVIFPGGLVDGKFVDWTDAGVEVRAGDTLFLMLEAIPERPGFYVVAHGFDTGFFRMVDSPRGHLMAGVAGEIVVATPCDSSMFRAVYTRQEEASPDVDEDGHVDVTLLDNLIALDDPESIGILWCEAIAALVECGGEQ